MQKTLFPQKQILSIHFPSYEITFDRFSERLTKVFSPVELKEYLTLYEESKKNPSKAKPLVEEFQKKYPQLPEVYNLLTYIYVRLRKIKKAEKLTRENYTQNPDYLFAKINYADQCLRLNAPLKVLEIFQQKFQLNELYPERKTFHYSEIVGFMCLMSLYHLKVGDKERAEAYYLYAKEIDPDDPTVLLIHRKLHKKNFIQKLMKRLKRA